MPIYEYECQSCGDRFEAFRSVASSDDKVKCPNCGSKNCKKVISSFFGRNAGDSCGSVFGGG